MYNIGTKAQLCSSYVYNLLMFVISYVFLSLANPIQPSLLFVSTAGAYPRLCRKKLSSLFDQLVSYEEKSFITVTPGSML
jgi:hypothetical protein